MWERLTELLTKIGLRRGETVEALEIVDDPDIQFQSLSPTQAAALGTGAALICPVTRQLLQEVNFFYLCRDCNTAYSAEGWDFLRETDHGRCCHCRHIGSVVPCRQGETHL